MTLLPVAALPPVVRAAGCATALCCAIGGTFLRLRVASPAERLCVAPLLDVHRLRCAARFTLLR
jgi:hypothetical protein